MVPMCVMRAEGLPYLRWIERMQLLFGRYISVAIYILYIPTCEIDLYKLDQITLDIA